ncbi:hypothetical protein LJR219_001061 [Phenylobacterium sp. LjRoot219]|uniref:hypothetical protein n=1 Tax=Phenylobacterium sp. LjRoot219 TaxID=3342283 RepID=UPI003ECCAEF1
MTAADSTSDILHLTLSEIRRLDIRMDLAAARVPGQVKAGVRSPNGAAVAGFNGHLFIGDGANHWEIQHLGRANIQPEWFAGWRDVLARRQAEAARRGVALWNLVVPEKQVVLPEQRWAAPVPDGAQRPLNRLLPELGPQTRLHYAAPALIASKPYGPAYFRRNSHWTPSACCAALFDFLGVIGVGADPETQPFAYRRARAASTTSRPTSSSNRLRRSTARSSPSAASSTKSAPCRLPAATAAPASASAIRRLRIRGG